MLYDVLSLKSLSLYNKLFGITNVCVQPSFIPNVFNINKENRLTNKGFKDFYLFVFNKVFIFELIWTIWRHGKKKRGGGGGGGELTGNRGKLWIDEETMVHAFFFFCSNLLLLYKSYAIVLVAHMWCVSRSNSNKRFL